MNFLNKVRELFSENQKVANREYIKNVLPDSIDHIPLDGQYRLYSRKRGKKWIKDDISDVRKYQRDYFDCDDFSFSFKAHMNLKHHWNAVGLVIDYKSKHSYNLIVWPDESYSLFEPQSDELFSYKERNQDKYHFDGSIVIL